MITMLGDGTDNAPDPSRALNAVRSPPRRAPSLAELTQGWIMQQSNMQRYQ